MPDDRADFLVLGGGPAGAVFACLAAQDGARVVLVERHGYGPRRPGEYLDGRCRDLLEPLGLTPARADGVMEPSAATISLWDSAVPVSRSFRAGDGTPPLAVRRHDFDRLLCDLARHHSAEVLTSATPATVEPVATGWHAAVALDGGVRSLAAGCVVDATGRTAGFARARGAVRQAEGALFATALWCRARTPGGHAVGPLVVEAAGDGWWSLAETPGGDLVAVYYTHRGTLPARRDRRTAHTLACLGRAPFIARRLARRRAAAIEARSVAAFPSVLSVAGGDRWVAIGDAAATYDPLCGKGTVFAMQSAWRAYEAWRAPDRPSRDLYREAIRARYEAHLATRRQAYLSADARLSEAFLAGL